MIIAGNYLDWPDTVRKGLGIVIGLSIGFVANWESQRGISSMNIPAVPASAVCNVALAEGGSPRRESETVVGAPRAYR
jgi:hypothetical protein